MDFSRKATLDSEGRVRQAHEPRKDGSGVVIVSYNWCDKRTWYQASTRKTGHTLTQDTGLVYESGIANWIDLTHGRLYREDMVSASHLVNVYDDGEELTGRAPFADSGGDYVVDYAAGKVTLAQAPSGVVTADFSHENGSLFKIQPAAGKRLWVEDSKVQFSTNIVLNDTVHFQAWAYDPEDYPNKKAVTSATTYKTAGDYIDEAKNTLPQIPAFGGASRGLSQPTLTLPFQYLQLKELYASQGLEIRVWLENDTEFGGERATATFYCTSMDE